MNCIMKDDSEQAADMEDPTGVSFGQSGGMCEEHLVFDSFFL